MLSSLPKLAEKNFIIGFIVPVLLGAVGLLALLRDLRPFKSVYATAMQVDSFEKLTLVGLMLWAAAILLLLANTLLYRVMEGYTGPLARSGWQAAMRAKYSEELDRLSAAYATISQHGAAVTAEAKREYFRQVWRFGQSWPAHLDLVLPTRFGNVVRASETYALKNYGADAVPTWLRLQGVMPADARAMVDDARAQVDFFVNVWFVTSLFVAVAIGRALVGAWPLLWQWHVIIGRYWGFAVAAAAGIVVMRVAYAGAIDRASSWGNVVRSSFDLYLPALASQLGYGLPPTEDQRRQFWECVTSSFLYQAPIKPEDWPRMAEATPTARPPGG